MYMKQIKNKIEHIINKIYEHHNKLQNIDNSYISDDIYYNGIMMSVFQTINYSIDLMDFFLIIKKQKVSKYRELPEKLFDLKIIDENTRDCLEELISYRNIVAHEYHHISKEDLNHLLEIISCVEILTEKIEIEINK